MMHGYDVHGDDDDDDDQVVVMTTEMDWQQHDVARQPPRFRPSSSSVIVMGQRQWLLLWLVPQGHTASRRLRSYRSTQLLLEDLLWLFILNFSFLILPLTIF